MTSSTSRVSRAARPARRGAPVRNVSPGRRSRGLRGYRRGRGHTRHDRGQRDARRRRPNPTTVAGRRASPRRVRRSTAWQRAGHHPAPTHPGPRARQRRSPRPTTDPATALTRHPHPSRSSYCRFSPYLGCPRSAGSSGVMRSGRVEQVQAVCGGGGLAAGGNAELAEDFDTCTLAVLGEMSSSAAISCPVARSASTASCRYQVVERMQALTTRAGQIGGGGGDFPVAVVSVGGRGPGGRGRRRRPRRWGGRRCRG